MSRGFIDKINGRRQARFVKSPYNARDPGVPRNQVIFDTENFGTQSLLVAPGSYTFTYGGSLSVGPTVIASWSDPGFIPLCDIQFAINGGPRDIAYTMTWAEVYQKGYRAFATRTGITASLALPSSSATVTIHWVAYRLAVA